MTSDSGETDRPGPQYRARAWWQWVLGAGLLGTAVVFTVIRYTPSLHTVDETIVETLQEVSVSDTFKPADRIPVPPGQLAGHNVMLVSMDTTRADRLGCYGCRTVRTPTLDYLANQGVIFSHAIGPGSTTLPAHSTMLTGLHPLHHGARANGMYRLEEEQRTLAEVFSEAGYATAAMVSAPVLGSVYGMAQGFDTFDEEFPDTFVSRLKEGKERRARGTTDAALAWLKRHQDEPFFMWVHYFDPHRPLEPPEEFASQYPEGYGYYAEITYMDSQISRLIDALDEAGLTDKTIVVAAADHGESLGQHGETTHGVLVYDETVRVPLIMRLGGVPGGIHIGRPVQLVDIAPTVLSMVGLEIPDPVDGIDLTQEIPETRPAYVETFEGLLEFGWAVPRGVRQYPYKYIQAVEGEFYDLSADPFELTNLIEERPEEAEALRQQLVAFYGDDLKDSAVVRTQPVGGAEAMRDLAALGYVKGPDELPAKRDRPDARKMLAVKLEAEKITVVAGMENAVPRAVKQLTKLASEHPRALSVWEFLAESHTKLEQYREAAQAYERLLELSPHAPYALRRYAKVSLKLGDAKKAEALFKAVLEQYPGQADVTKELGVLLFSQQRIEEAAALLTVGFEYNPRELLIVDGLDNALTRLGRVDTYLKLLEDALARNPSLHLARSRLAARLAIIGQRDQALALLREGVKLYPRTWDLANNLALLLTGLGEGVEATDAFEAVNLMERVCRASGFKNVRYLRTLATTYKCAYRMDEAIAVLERAQKLLDEDEQATIGQMIAGEIGLLKQFQAQGVTPVSPLQGVERVDPADSEKAG